MAKILIVEGDKVKPLDEAKFTLEGKLQDYLESFPSLIPLEEIDETAPKLVCIGKEVGVVPGAMDLLFIDANGILTIVETKLAKNPEARRTVIGQIIEYTSYVSEWTADKVEELANAYLKSDLYEAMEKFVEGDFSAEDFRASIEQNLRNGRIRLIIAVDELVEPLRKTVTYLNSHSDFNILLLLVKRFEESSSRSIFIPSLFGYTAKKPQEGGRQWDEVRFFNVLRNRCDPDAVEIVEKLYKFTKEHADRTWWGTGVHLGSFTFHKARGKGWVSIFSISTEGRVGLSFGNLWDKLTEETIEPFREKLNQVSGISFSKEAAGPGKFPSVEVRVLSQGDNLDRFKDAVLSLCQAVKSQGE